MTELEERTQFDAFMARNVARLQDAAKRYVGRLVPEQNEQFLAFALAKAWETREHLKPRKSSYAEVHVDILYWWNEFCLRPAALSRTEWTLRTWDGGRETVSGRRLGGRSR